MDAGIMIGSPHFILLDDRQLSDIQHWLSVFNPGKTLPPSLSRVVRTYSRILKHNDYDYGVVFRRQEHVILLDYEQPIEWVLKISQFLVYGPVFDQYYHFVDGEYFIAKSARGEPVIDSWTQQPWMVKQSFVRLCVQPMRQVSRKVILYPHDSLQDHFLVIDFNGPIAVRDVPIPYCPQVGEVVKALSHAEEIFVFVSTIHTNNFVGTKLRRVRGSCSLWVQGPQVECALQECLGSVSFTRNIHHFLLDL